MLLLGLLQTALQVGHLPLQVAQPGLGVHLERAEPSCGSRGGRWRGGGSGGLEGVQAGVELHLLFLDRAQQAPDVRLPVGVEALPLFVGLLDLKKFKGFSF